MKQSNYYLFFFFFIMSFSGCYRYIYWAESIVCQGTKIETCFSVVQPYIRSARAYDQFTTLGLFDALWINKQVLQAYACAYNSKYGLNAQEYDEFLEKQYEEFSPYISFYLLAVIPGNVGFLLTEENPQWIVQLKINNNFYSPAKIKLVELSHEFRYFFGKYLTVFKKQYLVQFNAYDENNNPVLFPGVSTIELVLRRVGYETSICWPLDMALHVIDTNPLQEDIMMYDLKTNI